jgi:hypothetical protein
MKCVASSSDSTIVGVSSIDTGNICLYLNENVLIDYII